MVNPSVPSSFSSVQAGLQVNVLPVWPVAPTSFSLCCFPSPRSLLPPLPTPSVPRQGRQPTPQHQRTPGVLLGLLRPLLTRLTTGLWQRLQPFVLPRGLFVPLPRPAAPQRAQVLLGAAALAWCFAPHQLPSWPLKCHTKQIQALLRLVTKCTLQLVGPFLLSGAGPASAQCPTGPTGGAPVSLAHQDVPVHPVWTRGVLASGRTGSAHQGQGQAHCLKCALAVTSHCLCDISFPFFPSLAHKA